MPTNAEIHAAIDLLVRQPHNSIVTDSMADIFDDMVDNIEATPTIYSGDGNLSTHRAVNLNDKSISFQNAGFNYFIIDPVVGPSLYAFHPTGNGNLSGISASADATEVQSQLVAGFNETEKSAVIIASANVEGSKLLHEADRHVFINVLEFADNAAAVTGGLEVGTIYRTGDLMKIVH